MLGTLATIGIGGLVASSVISRSKTKKGNDGQPTHPYIGYIKNALTKTLIPSLRPSDYTTIESAFSNQNPKNLSGKNSNLAKIKTGHVFGLGYLLFSLVPFGLKKIIDFDTDSFLYKLAKVNLPISILAGIGSILTATFSRNDYENSIFNLLDNCVRRYQVKKDGSCIPLSSEKNEIAEKFPQLSDVVLSPENRGAAITKIKDAKNAGQVMNMFGSVGTGKTMTAKAIAREIAAQDYYDKDSIQVWYANKDMMEKSMADSEIGSKIIGFLSAVLGDIGLETISQRVERLIANAIKHYRETGEYVVIILDEAHEMLINDPGNTFGYNPVDPRYRTKTANELGELCDKVRGKEICKGIFLSLTSNVGIHQISPHLLRRLGIHTFNRPDKTHKEELIKNQLKIELSVKPDEAVNPKVLQELKYNDFESEPVQTKIKEIACIGSAVNLIKELFGEDGIESVPKGTNPAVESGESTTVDALARVLDRVMNDRKAREENRIDTKLYRVGLEKYERELRSRDMLHCQHITDAVHNAIINYNGGGVNKVLEFIEQSLKTSLKQTIDNRAEWEGEIRFAAGEIPPENGFGNPKDGFFDFLLGNRKG